MTAPAAVRTLDPATAREIASFRAAHAASGQHRLTQTDSRMENGTRYRYNWCADCRQWLHRRQVFSQDAVRGGYR
jgi:hypothetical protein